MLVKGHLKIDTNEFSEYGNYKVYPTLFDKCYIVTPYVFRDGRGAYTETFNEELISDFFPTSFVQDDFSVSYKNVLRGFHGDYKTSKFVSCPYGSITNVIVDLNLKSPTFGKWGYIRFSHFCEEMLLIPSGFGNLIISHEDNSVYWYKQTTYYMGAVNQFTLLWNDPILNIPWENIVRDVRRLIVSERDKNGMMLEELINKNRLK